MAYKIGSIPNSKAYKEDIADFWEEQAIRNMGSFVSNIKINKIIAIEFDEINNDGIDSEEDINEDILTDVFLHIKKRKSIKNIHYPFNLGMHSVKIDGIDEMQDYLYVFLFLCTRLNMQKSKIQNGVDGTLLFESLCANVAKNYFGKNAESIVFGTGIKGGFEEKVKDMIKRIGEGEQFSNPEKTHPTKRDDGVDIVVWKNFSDNNIGKLIGFGQCKTGTSTWRDDIHKLKPVDFCSKWFSKNPVFEPIPLVFITDTMYEDLNFYGAQKGFLVFNRFRIMEYALEDLSPNIITDMKKWVDSAMLLLN